MDVFYGRVTDSMAHVYVRAPRGAANDTCTVTGWIRGPHCTLSHTLPATIALQDLGAGPTLLGSAAVPDPCFWSPQLPALYDVHVELRDGANVLQTFAQTIGIRRLGAAGRNLLWESKRWVLRGVAGDGRARSEDAVADDLATFRAASAALLVDDPDALVCRSASRAGVVLVARLTDPTEIPGQLAELARWGAVAIVILPREVESPAEVLHDASPNLLLAQSFPDDARVVPAAWADLIVCRVSQIARFHAAVADCPLPIIAERELNEVTPVVDARAACDQLQRDLAPGGDYAGYLMSGP